MGGTSGAVRNNIYICICTFQIRSNVFNRSGNPHFMAKMYIKMYSSTLTGLHSAVEVGGLTLAVTSLQAAMEGAKKFVIVLTQPNPDAIYGSGCVWLNFLFLVNFCY